MDYEHFKGLARLVNESAFEMTNSPFIESKLRLLYSIVNSDNLSEEHAERNIRGFLLGVVGGLSHAYQTPITTTPDEVSAHQGERNPNMNDVPGVDWDE